MDRIKVGVEERCQRLSKRNITTVGTGYVKVLDSFSQGVVSL
jgi:hypothetical protein